MAKVEDEPPSPTTSKKEVCNQQTSKPLTRSKSSKRINRHPKRHSHRKSQANVEDPAAIGNHWCLGCSLATQVVITVFACLLAAFASGNFSDHLQTASYYFAILQSEPLICLFIGVCAANRCFVFFLAVNCLYFSVVELVVALYITINDTAEGCQQWGCTPFKGQLSHRIFFVFVLLIAATVHAILGISFVSLGYMNPIRDSSVSAAITEVPSRKRQRKALSSRSQSRSTSAKRKHHVAVTAVVSKTSVTSSWKSLPTTAETAATITAPGAYFPSTIPSGSSISSCPYSAALLAHAHAKKYQPALQPVYVPQTYPSSETFSITLPTNSASEFQTLVVRMPPWNQIVTEPSQSSNPSQQPLVTFPSSDSSRTLLRSVPTDSLIKADDPKKAANDKISQSSATGSNFSEFSENKSLILPDSFVSRDDINGAQGIFTANIPSKKDKK